MCEYAAFVGFDWADKKHALCSGMLLRVTKSSPSSNTLHKLSDSGPLLCAFALAGGK